jgi:Mn2+/Fe2+ NRAMP family transporter
VASLLRGIGPGIVVAGSVIGAGELINTPQRAATYGFTILWAIVLACVLKYWLQVELGRFCIASRLTTVEALNTLPGPRWRGTHIIPLLYMFGFLLSMATLTGIVTATAGLLADVMRTLLPSVLGPSLAPWAALLYVLTIVIVYTGSYRGFERFVMTLVAGFTFSVLLCLALIQFGPYRISAQQLLSGLAFDAPPGSGYYLISLFGALGTGANELFMYPYWLRESGYGDSSRARERIELMKIDVAFATVIATVVTLGYYLVAAAVLYGRDIGGIDVVRDVSRMFTDTYGPWSYLVFMVGAFCTLYSTLAVMAFATGRMLADLGASLQVLDRKNDNTYRRVERGVSLAAVTLWFAVALFVREPGNFIAFGQFALGLVCTPLLLVAIVMLGFRTKRHLRMSPIGAVCLVGSALALAAVILRTSPDSFANLQRVMRELR